MAYLNTSAIVTRIREVCEAATDSLRPVPVDRFTESYSQAQDVAQARRATVNPTYDVSITNGPNPHKSSPTEQSAIAIYDLEIRIDVIRAFDLTGTLDDAVRDEVLGLAVQDGDVLQQAFSTYGNLRSTSDDDDTGIVSGVMKYQGSSSDVRLSEGAGNMVAKTSHRFSMVAVADIAQFLPTSIPNMVAWWRADMGRSVVDAEVSGTASTWFSDAGTLAAYATQSATLADGTTGTVIKINGVAQALYPHCGQMTCTNYLYNSSTEFSVIAKAGTVHWLILASNAYAGEGVTFDLQNGVVGSAYGLATKSGSIEPMGNGWYRCTITVDNSYYCDTTHQTGYGAPWVGLSATNSMTGYVSSSSEYLYAYSPTVSQTNVSAWADQASGGTDFDLTAPATASLVEYVASVSSASNRPAMMWHGSSQQGLTYSTKADLALLHDGTGMTMYMVCLPYWSSGCLVNSSQGGTIGAGIGMYLAYTDRLRFVVTNSARSVVDFMGAPATYTAASPMWWIASHNHTDAPRAHLQTNMGSDASDFDYATPDAGASYSPLAFGRYADPNGHQGLQRMLIFEAGVYSSALSTSYKTLLINYIKARYGIA